MATRVSHSSRAGDVDTPRNLGAARQATRPPYSSLPEAIDAIKADIQAGEESAIPECTTSEVTLGYDAALELHRPNIGPYSEGGDHDLPADFKTNWTAGDGSDGLGGKSYPTANVDDITGLGDRDARAVVQRAASRGIVAAVELADGFKYSMNNAWTSKDADGQRFSYICQDSMQNKDRHANGFTRTQKHLKGDHERGPRKPTYDCKGSVSIKCSMVRRTIDIFYRHYAIHSSVAERRQVPRPPPRPRVSIAGDEGSSKTPEKGGLLARLQHEESAFAPPPTATPTPQGGSNIGRPLKRKRDVDTTPKPEKPLSLFDLLKQSEAGEKSKVQTPNNPPSKPATMHPPPMNYDLPSWQAPPPPPPAPPPVSIPRAQQSASNPPPYQPPYQPQHLQQTPHHQPLQRRTPTSARPPSSSTYNGTGGAPIYPNQPPSSTPTAATQTGSTGNTPLFTTMKPFRVETPQTTYSGRTRSSCTNCRYGKKKCDEQRPICGNCAKGGKYDCAFDGAYGYPATQQQQAQMGGWAAVPSPVVVEVSAPEIAGGQGYHTGGGGGGKGEKYPDSAPQPQQQVQAQGQGRHQPAQYQAQTMGQYAQQNQQPQATQREGSPDPWFPKR